MRRLLTACCLVLCVALPTTAARGANVSEFIDFSLRTPQQLLLPGRLYVPPEAIADPVTKRPLVVWLHGGGDRGDNNLNQIRWDIDLLFAEAKRRGAFLLAPQAPLNWRPKAITDLAMTMLDRAVGEFNIDPERLYLTGYSSGGGGVWNMLSRYPDRFAASLAVAPVSTERDFTPANVVGQPLSVFHARNDSVASVFTTRSIVNQVLMAAGKPTPAYPSPLDPPFAFEAPDIGLHYFEPNLGDHSVHFAVYNTPQVYEWMFAHGAPVPEPGGWGLLLAGCLTVLRTRRDGRPGRGLRRAQPSGRSGSTF